MRELGYVEGKNLVIEWRFAEGRTELLPVLAAELVRLQVDVIVTNGTAAAIADAWRVAPPPSDRAAGPEQYPRRGRASSPP